MPQGEDDPDWKPINRRYRAENQPDGTTVVKWRNFDGTWIKYNVKAPSGEPNGRICCPYGFYQEKTFATLRQLLELDVCHVELRHAMGLSDARFYKAPMCCQGEDTSPEGGNQLPMCLKAQAAHEVVCSISIQGFPKYTTDAVGKDRAESGRCK